MISLGGGTVTISARTPQGPRAGDRGDAHGLRGDHRGTRSVAARSTRTSSPPCRWSGPAISSPFVAKRMASATRSIATEGRTPEEIAERDPRGRPRETLAMPLGTRTYVVELADGEPARLTAALEELAPSSLLVVTDSNVSAARGAWLERRARAARDAAAHGDPHARRAEQDARDRLAHLGRGARARRRSRCRRGRVRRRRGGRPRGLRSVDAPARDEMRADCNQFTLDGRLVGRAGRRASITPPARTSSARSSSRAACSSTSST